MEKRPLLSVIVPIYNGEAYLDRCLSSLCREQTLTETYEVILVLDPSKDGSLLLAQSYAQRYPFVRLLVSSDRLGIGASRMKGIEASKGDYFYFVDADDYLRPDCLEVLLKTIQNEKADCVGCSFYYVSKQKTHRNAFAKHAVLKGKDILDEFFGDSYLRGFCWTKIYSRRIAENRPLLVLGAPLDMQFEDTALNCSLLSYCQKVVLIKDPLYYYVKTNAGSAMSSKRANRAFRHLVVLALCRYFLQTQGDQNGLKAFRRHLLRSKASLVFDVFVDKHNGCDKAYLRQVHACWALVGNMKRPLDKKGSFFEKDADSAFYR